MSEAPQVSICIPHWQVQELATLCLRAIRKHTSRVSCEVIVVDNGSRDASLDYLRSLPWIRLIERGEDVPENWVQAFATALDLGFSHSRGRYFAIMHTDTIVKHPRWLDRLILPLETDPACAVSGAWKLERRHPILEFTKWATDTKKARLWLRRTLLREPGAYQVRREVCPRDYCALYRSEIIRTLGLRFDCAARYPGYNPGERMYLQLMENGYRASVVPTEEMMRYVIHLAHATAGLRPGERRLRHRRTQKKSERRLRRLFSSDLGIELANDVALDR
jgi:GT2 family glycosyltransferase